MKKIIIFLLPLLFFSCGTKKAVVDQSMLKYPGYATYSGYSGNLDLNDRYKLFYLIDLSFDTKNIKAEWSKAYVVDKQTNDSVVVNMEHLRCALISNPPSIYAGVFDIKHQNQSYIVHFLFDPRTYINKTKGELKSTEKCYNVEDLDPDMLKKFSITQMEKNNMKK